MKAVVETLLITCKLLRVKAISKQFDTSKILFYCWAFSHLICSPTNAFCMWGILWQDCRVWGAVIIFHSCTCPCTATQVPCVVTVSSAENNRWTLNPSIPKCYQPAMRRCVTFIFCKVRKCWWKDEVGTDRSVIAPNPCSGFRHSLLCTGTAATARTCQSPSDLAWLPVYRASNHMLGYSIETLGSLAWLMCSRGEPVLPGVVMPLMRRTCGAGTGHTSPLMTF